MQILIEMAQRDIKMSEVKEIKDELNQYTDSIDNLTKKLDRLNTLFEHYMYNVHGVRAPNTTQDAQKTTEH